jgi:hypothetical protein
MRLQGKTAPITGGRPTTKLVGGAAPNTRTCQEAEHKKAKAGVVGQTQ